MSKTTLDLSTLSDITDGTHTVKVKAKANGYWVEITTSLLFFSQQINSKGE